MRTLSITRIKRIVGCAGKMTIFVEDPDNGDWMIKIPNSEGDGVEECRCRLAGMLKNGATVTYQIPESATKIVVTAGRFFCDCYLLPVGKENVSLTGRNRLQPNKGNPFMFDRET